MSRKDVSGSEYADFKTQGHKTRAGDFEMVILGADYVPSGTAVEGYIQVESVEEIKYEFDMPDNEEDPKSVQLNAGSLDVTVWDSVEMSDGTFRKLHEQLFTADASQFPFEVEVKIVRGGSTYTFSLEFGYDDIDYDYVTRKLELQLHSANNFQSEFSPTIYDYVDNASSNGLAQYTMRETESPYPFIYAVAIYPMLEDAVQMLNPSFPVEISSDNFFDQTVQNKVSYFLTAPLETATPYYGEDFDDQETTIFDQMAYLAAAEGAFYGQGFSKCFYIQRNNKESSYEKTISYDTIEELEIIERRNSDLLYVESNVIGRPLYRRTTGENTTFNDEYWLFETAKETFDTIKNDRFFASSHPLGFVSPFGLYLTGAGVDEITFEDPDNHFTDIDAQRTTQYQNLADSGLEAYKRALGASNPLRIKITGWDIFNLRPYEWFNFSGSNVPSLLQGKDFRISEISYNLQTDKYTVEAYEF
jgi:hypothetical protein